MRPEHAAEVLIVSLGATEGLRRADRQLADSLSRAGAHATIAQALAPTELRTLMLTDLAWARAARRAARNKLEQLEREPRAIIYSSTTAALLWPAPGAIRFDAPAAGNRPGRHGLWQRPLERRRLKQAPLLLPWSEGALREANARGASRASGASGDRALVLPVAVEPSAAAYAPQERDVAAITYAANPHKKGLDRVIAAWGDLRRQGGLDAADELLVTGTSAAELGRAGIDLAGVENVRVLSPLSSEEYRALVRRARVFVCAPRREDYGIAQLEALADGCMLVTTPAPGPYAALPIARGLDARLVGEELTGALRVALTDPMPDYRSRASEALRAFDSLTFDRLVAEQLLPRLLA
jgi:hypothetical protein